MADTVAKVGNRAVAKISRKSIFGRLRCCNALQDRYDGCGRFCVRRFGPSRRHVRNASAVLKNFVRHPKKTFSTLLAQSGHSSILTDNEFMQSFEPKPRGAPAKKPRRTARELTTFRSPPENLLVRTNRVRTAKKQVCEKWTLTLRCQIP